MPKIIEIGQRIMQLFNKYNWPYFLDTMYYYNYE